jgi:hypothetical protein
LDQSAVGIVHFDHEEDRATDCSGGHEQADYNREIRGRENAQAIADAVVKRAMKGEISACCELADRVEGKPLQALAISREEEHVDVFGIIQRLTGPRTSALEPGGAAPDSSDTVSQ